MHTNCDKQVIKALKVFFLSLAFTGAQLSARVVDAVVNGTMTIESLQDEVISESQQTSWNASLGTLGVAFGAAFGSIPQKSAETTSTSGFHAFMGGVNRSPLSMIPTFRSENRHHVEKVVQQMAQFVGEEEFALKVAQALIKRSAEVGLRVDGVAKDSGLEAPKIINQPLQAVRIDRYNAISVPLTDAIAFFGAVDELTLLRRQAFEAMKTQGISDREAMEVLNLPEVKEELGKIAEVQHKIFEEKNKIEQNFDKRERELLQKTEDIAPTVNAWDLWESGSVNEFLSEENLTLEHQVALNKICTDYEQIQAERRQNHAGIDYQCFSAANFAYKKAAQLAERHPKAAEAVLATIHVLTDALECYGTIQGGLLGAKLGSVAGPYGTVAGAVGGMMLTQGTAKAFAEGLDAGVQQVKGYATKLAKNEAEVAEFCRAVEGLAGAGALVLTLKGGQHLLRKQHAAKMARLRNDALNKSPYHPRRMEAMLKQGEADVTSSTLPRSSAKNVALAGQRHPKTGVVFDQRGFPVYDGISKVEVRIEGDLSHMKPEAHKISATKQLRADIEAGKIDRKLFSVTELDDIFRNKPKIGEYTWHHHQDTGRMQLVPSKIHQQTGHIGGDAMWGMEEK